MATFEPVRKSAIAEEISARLLSLIQEKQLKPGDKLPPERELAATMQVSRPSLREALRASMMNVVEIRQGDGTYVTSLEPDLLVEHLDFVISLDDSTIHHLFEVRRILEVGIAGSGCASAASDAQTAALEAMFNQSVECRRRGGLPADRPGHARADGRGHRQPLLKRVMASMSRMGLASRSRTGASQSVRDRTVTDHRAIVAAIKAHDPDAAAQAMLDHLDHVERSLGKTADLQDLADRN
ncbi:MAG: FadR family transcriptional regulator [Anaerolineales bacterium]|nr:FadR family transcriptional regulator [Anaerolineales bacterium]